MLNHFYNITLFSIEANNSDFWENELIDVDVSSEDGEYFRGFFSEGFGKAGKLIEIRCESTEITIETLFLEKMIEITRIGKYRAVAK